MREISYSQNGEYQIPDISLEETRGTIGKYGMMRKEYLRNHKVARFNILTLQNRLDSHLMEIDSQARQRVDDLMNELLEKDPAPDKMADGMAWTRHMNQIKAQAEELVPKITQKIERMVLMMAMLWAQEIMSAETVEDAKALYERCPRLLKEKVKAILIKSGFEEITQ